MKALYSLVKSKFQAKVPLPEYIKHLLKKIIIIQEDHLIDFSLIKDLLLVLSTENTIDEYDLYSQLRKQFKYAYQSYYNILSKEFSFEAYYNTINLSIILYYLIYNMSNSKTFNALFFEKKCNLWSTLLSILSKVQSMKFNTQLNLILVSLISDPDINKVMDSYNLQDSIGYYSDKLSSIIPDINSYTLLREDNPSYINMIQSVMNIDFSYDNLLNVIEDINDKEAIIKSHFIQAILHIVFSDTIKKVNLQHETFVGDFLKTLITKSLSYYHMKFGDNINCLFRREEMYDDIMKYLIFTHCNSFYYNTFLSFLKSLIDIDIGPKGKENFIVVFEDFILLLEKKLPLYIKVIMKMVHLYCQKQFTIDKDNYYPCYTILFFNYCLSPRIQGYYDVSVNQVEKITNLNKIIMNICYNQPFKSNEKELVHFNQAIMILNNHLNKAMGNILDSVPLEKIDELLQKEKDWDIREPDKFIFCYSCEFLLWVQRKEKDTNSKVIRMTNNEEI